MGADRRTPEPSRAASPKAQAPEPYRVLFPMGVVFGVVAALVWPGYLFGWNPYPGALHATLMIQGFEHCFVLGFFLTALPAFTRSEKCKPWELAVAAGGMGVFGLLVAVGANPLAQLVYAATVALMLAAALGRLRRAITPAPEEFAFVIAGLAAGIAGGLLRALAEAGLVMEPAPRFGLRLVSLGMVLPIVLGFGALLVPTFTMMQRPLAVPGLAGAHERAPRRALYSAIIVVLFGALGAEMIGLARLGAWLRAFAGAVMIVWVWKLYRLPGRRDLLSAALWCAGWLILAGLVSAAVWPGQTLTAYHVAFVGGYGLLTLGISTRVTASHGGYGMPGEKRVLTAWVFGAAALALMLRLGGELRHPIGLAHLAASATAWMAAWMLWARGALPMLAVTAKPAASAPADPAPAAPPELAAPAGADPHNPQAQQMADESMVRNLAAQADAIWPQEIGILRGYRLPEDARILDVGCGTGEITARLADLLPSARLVGVDMIESHLALARARSARHGARIAYLRGNAFSLPHADGAFDLTVCRHVLQAVPTPEKAVAELMRVTRPGGRLHLIAEDYGMIFVHPTRYGAETFWGTAPAAVGPAFGTDLFIGRHLFPILHELGLERIEAHYLAVDTLRVPRETFAAIFEAWRDGFSEVIAEHTAFTLEEARARFDDMIACIRDPGGWALWLVPLYSAVVPARRAPTA